MRAPEGAKGRFVPVVDRERIYRERVVGRRIIYLDTGAWGELADNTATSRERVERYAAAVDSLALVFPSSFPAVSESLQHPHDEHRRRQLRTMDRLGRLVCFRQTRDVEEEETLWALPGVLGAEQPPPSRERVFTHVVENTGGTGGIQFPPEWHERGIDFMSSKIREALETYGLERIGNAMDLQKLRERHAKETEERMAERRGEAASRRNAAMFRRRDGKLDRERILFEEQAYFLKRATRRFAETLARDVTAGRYSSAQLREHFQRLERERGEPLGLTRLFRLMPSTGLRAEVFAHRVYEYYRRERPGDLYDNEHASVPPAYSDAFVSGDKGLVQLLRKCKVPVDRGCAILYGLEALDAYLASRGEEPPTAGGEASR